MSPVLKGESWITSNQKRLFDSTVACNLLPAVLPFAIVGGIAFLAETGVNPLFYQRRIGQSGKDLHILKLRSMPSNKDFSDASNGHLDPRASRIGRVLRKTTLDEAPQVFHILIGQMSVVGPRPLVPSDVEKTLDLLNPHEQAEWLRSRSIAKPGWLSAFGNISRTMQPQTEAFLLARVEYDIDYLALASYKTDIQIIRDAIGTGRSMAREFI